MLLFIGLYLTIHRTPYSFDCIKIHSFLVFIYPLSITVATGPSDHTRDPFPIVIFFQYPKTVSRLEQKKNEYQALEEQRRNY